MSAARGTASATYISSGHYARDRASVRDLIDGRPDADALTMALGLDLPELDATEHRVVRPHVLIGTRTMHARTLA